MEDFIAPAERGMSRNWCMSHVGTDDFYVSGRNGRYEAHRVNVAREILQQSVGEVAQLELCLIVYEWRTHQDSNLRPLPSELVHCPIRITR